MTEKDIKIQGAVLHHSHPPTVDTTKDVDMGMAAGALEHSCHENIVFVQGCSADRAVSLQVSFDTVQTAPDMHQAVPAAGYRRVGKGSDQISFFQLGRADRADLRLAGGC